MRSSPTDFGAIVGNTSPWTYFGSRPVVLTPDATFDRGLDLIALQKLRTMGTLWAASGMLTAKGIRGRSTLVLEDLAEFTLVADRPVHMQVDGDYLGIDQGPMLLMIENQRSGLVWRLMRGDPSLVRGLCRAGFSGGWLAGRCGAPA